MTRSGSGNPRSTPASTEMGSGSGGVLMLNLAAVKAVPENAYRSHTIIAPEFKVLWMAALDEDRPKKFNTPEEIKKSRSQSQSAPTSSPNGWQKIGDGLHGHRGRKCWRDTS